MPKPPQGPPAPRKIDTNTELTAGRPFVARRADRRQADLFDTPLPDWVKPCLPTLVETPPVGPKWIHEIKWDGYRVSVYVENGKAVIRTRGGHDWTARFPAIRARRRRAAGALSRARPYRSGRQRDWLKTKCVKSDVFVVIGYQPGSNITRVPIANIKIARVDEAGLTYAGTVGTGFSDRVAEALRKRLDAIATPRCAVQGLKVGGAVWIAPELQAEIA